MPKKPTIRLRTKSVNTADKNQQFMQDYVRDLADQIEPHLGVPGAQGPEGPAGADGPAGPAGSGALVGRSYSETTTHITTAHDESLTAAPDHTKGTTVLTISYAASDAANKIRVTGNLGGSVTGTVNMIGELWKKDTTTNLDAEAVTIPTGYFDQLDLCSEFVAGDTASHDYEMRCSGDNINLVAIELNWAAFAGAAAFGGKAKCWLMVEELKP